MQRRQVEAIKLLKHPLRRGLCARCEAVVAEAETGKRTAAVVKAKCGSSGSPSLLWSNFRAVTCCARDSRENQFRLFPFLIAALYAKQRKDPGLALLFWEVFVTHDLFSLSLCILHMAPFWRHLRHSLWSVSKTQPFLFVPPLDPNACWRGSWDRVSWEFPSARKHFTGLKTFLMLLRPE